MHLDPSPVSRPSRRGLLTGTGVGATMLALSACSDEDSGAQEPGEQESAPTVTVTEYVDALGDWTVWQVGYDLGEGEEAPEIYSATTQAARHEALRAKQAEQLWTATDPLLVLDPYGTTRTGLYVHFEDADPGRLDITSAALATEDYTTTAANHAETGFEGLLVALIPGAHNTLTLTWTSAGGAESRGQVRIKAPAVASAYATNVAAEISDGAALTPGLFALSGVSGPGHNTFLFDNQGVMRAEVAAGDSPAHRFVLQEGRLVLTTGSRQVSVLDPFGHAGTIIDLGDHSVHHDLTVVDGAAYVLTSEVGSERVEDRVIRVDLDSGDVTEVVDLQKIFPAYEELARLQGDGEAGGSVVKGKDWIHINSVDVVAGVMYLSARETSTVIALDGALEPDSSPTVRWLIGPQHIWSRTGYEQLFLAAEGNPTGNAGQHSVVRIDDPALPEGQYYVEMFNNNYWSLDTREASDWEDHGPADASLDEREGVSHVLRYLIDENAGTFREDEVIEVPYSSVVSNAYRLGDGGIDAPMVVNSGRSNVYAERAADGSLLAGYRYDSENFGYRVYKDTFEGFWFSGS